MARRRGRRRGRKSFKIPIVSLAILAGQAAYANASGTDLLGKAGAFAMIYTGLDKDGNWRPAELLKGWGPWVVKGLVSKVAGAVGRPRIPFGLPISIS